MGAGSAQALCYLLFIHKGTVDQLLEATTTGTGTGYDATGHGRDERRLGSSCCLKGGSFCPSVGSSSCPAVTFTGSEVDLMSRRVMAAATSSLASQLSPLLIHLDMGRD